MQMPVNMIGIIVDRMFPNLRNVEKGPVMNWPMTKTGSSEMIARIISAIT